jgi:hypothetical protein
VFILKLFKEQRYRTLASRSSRVILTGEVRVHVGGKAADCYHSIAQASFGAIEGIAPVVDFVNGLDIDARGIGRSKGKHRDGYKGLGWLVE